MKKLEIEFDHFLQDKHVENYIGTDDDMPDAFEAWAGNLDTEEMQDYGLQFTALKLREFGERLKKEDKGWSNEGDRVDVFAEGYNQRNSELNAQIDKELKELE